MRRREFIATMGSAGAWPLAARGQQSTMPVIGYLNGGSREGDLLRAAFLEGLKEIGYVEGRNVLLEYRWAGYQYDQLPLMANELVRRPVAIIFAAPITAALPAKAATSTIPIVFAIGSDP